LKSVQKLFDEAVEFVRDVDFSNSRTGDTVRQAFFDSFATFFDLTIATSVFESTIRYLGGLLSAYELSDEKHPILLRKARQLADKLAFAWVEVSFL
jgi:mannosyl-oligosaccharide alpha-1,2-mannosidase